MIAAVYARKSTEQNGVPDAEKSVTRQIDHARAYAERKGWQIDDRYIFIDDGISGAEFANRPSFLRLMNSLKPRAPFQVLVMSEESRLGRESIETAYALKQIMQAGVHVWCYLEDRERTLDSPTDKIMSALTGFADELEREKARQRTYDAMRRKAKAGHVTGGRVFGYDNHRTEAGHVERRINPAEAAIVRRIFELCIRGHGQISIAKQLNLEGAPAPRSQQGRPHAWAGSSVREVLHRDLYRGVVIWNRTRKRDSWGRVDATARPESEWTRTPAPQLRLISESVWNAAHARLAQSRESYLRATGGRLWGRPLDGVARKYLLTGLARCGHCGASLEVRSRHHGAKRVYFYSCSSFYRRGPAVCPNKLEIPLDATESAVLDEVEKALLTPAFVETVVRKVLTRRVPTGPAADDARAAISKQLAEVQRELDHLVDGLARTGASSAVTAAIRRREAQQGNLERELAGLEQRDQLSQTEVARLEALAREKVLDWRRTMRKHVPQARQVLQKMLRGRLTFTPEPLGRKKGYRFTGEGSLIPLLSGMIPGFESLQAVASPTGTDGSYQPVFRGIWRSERRAA